MNDVTRRSGGIGALAAVILGSAGAACERSWPGATDPLALSEFLAAHRAVILAQSMFFVSSAVVMLGVLAVLCHLVAASGHARVAATIALGAGAVGYGMNVVGQAPQVTLTLPTEAAIPGPTAGVLADLGYAVLALANAPIAVMFAALGVGIVRSRALPAWLGWLALTAACASALLAIAVIAPTGALAPQGWLSYTLYPVSIVWLTATGVVLLRASKTRADPSGPSRPEPARAGPGDHRR
jgi:hypothetical protein